MHPVDILLKDTVHFTSQHLTSIKDTVHVNYCLNMVPIDFQQCNFRSTFNKSLGPKVFGKDSMYCTVV